VKNEGDAVRDDAQDDFFAHLRKQDAEIAAIREDIQFLVDVSRNLEGFAQFCCRWGRRINRMMKWIATIVAPLVTVYALFKDSIDALFKRWFG